MKKLLILLLILISLSNCSRKVMPESSNAAEVAKVVQPKEKGEPIPWYQLVAGSLLLTIIIIEINK